MQLKLTLKSFMIALEQSSEVKNLDFSFLEPFKNIFYYICIHNMVFFCICLSVDAWINYGKKGNRLKKGEVHITSLQCYLPFGARRPRSNSPEAGSED